MKKASEEQARKFAGVLVEHYPFLTEAPATELQWAIQNPQDAIALFVAGLVERSKEVAVCVSEKAKQIVKRTLAPFITITIGNKTREGLATEVSAEASDYARDLMTKKPFVVATKPEQVTLIFLTIAELGFTSNPRTDEFVTKKFCTKWSAENLEGQVIELCEPEDGPQLRLQYRNQPKGETLWLAMERIVASGGSPRVFGVGCGGVGGCWLFAGWPDPDGQWDLGPRIVFRLRKLPLPSVV